MSEEREELEEQFVYRDFVTGRRGINQLNRAKLSKMEMDQMFNEWVYNE